MPADQIKFVASQGGAPALQDLVAGGITVFTGSPVEAKALAEAGEVKVLAIMADEPSEAFPGVPTIKDATGTDWSLANWFSLCAPAGLPEDVKATLVEKGKAAHVRISSNCPSVKAGMSVLPSDHILPGTSAKSAASAVSPSSVMTDRKALSGAKKAAFSLPTLLLSATR